MSVLNDVRERGAFKIENTEDAPLKIILKPWDQEISLAPNLAVEVFFVGDSVLSENLVVTIRPDALVLTVRDSGVAFFRMRKAERAANGGGDRIYSTAAE